MKLFKHIAILFALVLLVLTEVNAQKRKSLNLPEFDRRRFHFGFIIGFNSAHMELRRDGPASPTDSLHVIAVVPQTGFNLGIVSSLSLMENLKLRFVPSLSFAQRNLEYYFKRTDNVWVKEVKPVESTYVEFPLNLKLKSKRLNNFGAYLIGGANYSLDLIADENVDNLNKNRDDIVVKMKKNTISLEVGTGVDFYMEYFKFGIELKMSYTLENTHIQDNTIYSTPIQGLYPRMFLLSFTFEG